MEQQEGTCLKAKVKINSACVTALASLVHLPAIASGSVSDYNSTARMFVGLSIIACTVAKKDKAFYFSVHQFKWEDTPVYIYLMFL